MDIAGERLPLDVTRYYNSLSTASGMAAYGTTLGVGPDVHVTANADGSATLQGPSGFQVVYPPSNGAGGGYDIPAGYTDATLSTAAGGGWKLAYHDTGEVLTFNAAGNETADTAPSGETITFAYNAGTSTLAAVTDTEDRVTTFSNYTGNAVGLITDPTGRAHLGRPTPTCGSRMTRVRHVRFCKGQDALDGNRQSLTGTKVICTLTEARNVVSSRGG